MQNQELIEIIHSYIKENLKVHINKKQDWYTKEESFQIAVELGEDIIYRSETY